MATTKIRTGTPPPGALSGLEPLPDPPKDIDRMIQLPHIAAFLTVLSARYATRHDVFIGGEGYLCRHRSQPRTAWIVPDCIVVFDVPPDAVYDANGYVIDEVGKPPDFALEVASKSTARRDYTVKRDAYARYGVREYWRFDPSGGERYDAALAGDALVGDRYEPIQTREGADGVIRGYSAVLDIELHWDANFLRLYDPAAGEYLRTLIESEAVGEYHRAARLAAEARAGDAEARADSAEAEAQRLRAEIDRLRSER